MPVLLIPWLIGGAGVLALGGTAGFVAGGGVRAASDATKWATLAAIGVGAVVLYVKVLKKG